MYLREWSCGKLKLRNIKIMDQNDKNNEGIDLSGALKDSGTGVKFEEYRVQRSYYPGTPKIIQWVIKYSGGLIKDEKQASYVLLSLAGLFVIIIIFLFINISGSPSKPPAGYRGNIPDLDLPEYNNPPTPQAFR